MLGAEFMLLNLDVHELLAKWLQDVADTRRGEGAPSVIAPDGGWHVDWAPAPTWHSVLVLIPELLHRHRGDERLLRTLWPDICGYLQFELDRSTDGIATTTLGDWVAPGTDPGGGNPVEDPRVPATAFLYAMLRSAGRIARILGEQDEVWESAARGVRAAFLAEFFDDVLGVVR